MNYHIVIPIIILHRVNAWFRCNILFDYIYTRKRVSEKYYWIFFSFSPDRKREIDRCKTRDSVLTSFAFKVCEREKKLYIFIERETFNARGNARNTYKCALCESNYGIGRLEIYISGIPTNSNGRDLMNFHNGPGRDSWGSFNAMEKLFKTPTHPAVSSRNTAHLFYEAFSSRTLIKYFPREKINLLNL